MDAHGEFSPAFTPGPTYRRVVGNQPGAEGPIITLDGRVFMVAPDIGWIVEVNLEESTARNFVHVDGIPAGLQVDVNNDLWVADMKLGVYRVDREGEIFPEVTHWEGRPIRGCNDLAFDTSGNLYFTAPEKSGADHPVGEIFCRRKDGSVWRLDEGFAFCNGIAVSPDDTALIVAETFTKKLWRYDLIEPGRAVNKQEWATLPGEHLGGPDGIDFDPAGRLVATNWGAGHLEIFSPQGVLEDRLALPFDHPSNLHFLGQNPNCQILITEHTTHSLWVGPYQP